MPTNYNTYPNPKRPNKSIPYRPIPLPQRVLQQQESATVS